MRYFYYGNEQDGGRRRESTESFRRMNSSYGRGGYEDGQEESLVIEEDTIYEIDRECESCRGRQGEYYHT